MKIGNLKLVAFISLLWYGMAGQSYEQLEQRFVKSDLTAEDSAAFVEVGIQKVYSLIDFTEVHYSNAGNLSNQRYVENKVEELFYVPEGETLNVDSVVSLVRNVMQSRGGDPVKVIYSRKEGMLGHVTTNGDNPKYEADLILVQMPKKFGKKSKAVWQVFMVNPVLRF